MTEASLLAVGVLVGADRGLSFSSAPDDEPGNAPNPPSRATEVTATENPATTMRP
jgi:hypothetical protein